MCHLAVLASHSLLRAGLASILKLAGFGEIMEGCALDDLQGVGDVPTPDILLVSLSPSVIDITRLMDMIRAWAPTTKVVFLSPHLDVTELNECYAAGANGYLLENLSPEALQKSLAVVDTGEKVFPSELASVLVDAFRHTVANRVSELESPDLSLREVGILQLVADGQSNKVIAAKLNIAESTAKLHLGNILRKLRASNRTQAALWARQYGIVANGESPPVAI
jgi:two-component system, NarL family, nitrate/nitrite response regulator NarL